MNVDWVIPCRYIEIHDNLGTLVGAGIDTFWVSELPATIQVAMAIRLTALASELEPEIMHAARNIIRGPDGSTIGELNAEFSLGTAGSVERPDWLQGVMMHTVVGFEATEEGTYTFEHIVNQSSQSVPLHVVHGPAPGADQVPQEE